MEKIKEMKCIKCNKKVKAGLKWRANGEGEYKCPECKRDLMIFRRGDTITL